MPYYVAIRATARLLKKYPLVSAAYARNSFALGVWIPGRSDIDLTLILRTGETPQQELENVNGFWKDYAALQRWFPMLGEVEILNEAHFAAWVRFTVTGYEARYWLPVYGNDIDRSGYAGDEGQLRTDRLNHAVSIYYHQMIPVIGSAREEVLARYTKKILRYLDHPRAPCMDDQLAAMTREELQATVLRELDRKVREHDVRSSDEAALDLEYTLGRVMVPVVEEGQAPASLAGNAAAENSLEAVLQATNDTKRIYYIPREQLGDGVLRRCIGVANSEPGSAVVMTRAVFIHFLRHVNPMEYLVLLQNRMLRWGSDPMAGAAIWPEKVFHHAVCAYSVHILPFPYFPDPERMNASEFRELLLGWFLRTARYFEDGVVEFDHARLLEHWQKVHPEHGIADWQNCPDDPVRRFRLLRVLTDFIGKGMVQEAVSRKAQNPEYCDV